MAVSAVERPLSFDKLRMVSLVEPFAKSGEACGWVSQRILAADFTHANPHPAITSSNNDYGGNCSEEKAGSFDPALTLMALMPYLLIALLRGYHGYLKIRVVLSAAMDRTHALVEILEVMPCAIDLTIP